MQKIREKSNKYRRENVTMLHFKQNILWSYGIEMEKLRNF